MARLRKLWGNMKEMPTLLRASCGGAMCVGPAFVVSLLAPGQKVVNHRVMSYVDFWRSGAGEGFLLFAVLLTLGAWGMAARLSWSRWTIIAAFALPAVFIPEAIVPNYWGTIAYAAGTAVVAYGCLFHVPSVRRYFGANGSERPSA
jgi:hypothetical protein